MSSKHRLYPKYRAERMGQSWRVVDRAGKPIYDDLGGECPLDTQEAHDLAWAWNNGAQSDDEAVWMIEDRDRRYPTLANWRPEMESTAVQP